MLCTGMSTTLCVVSALRVVIVHSPFLPVSGRQRTSFLGGITFVRGNADSPGNSQNLFRGII